MTLAVYAKTRSVRLTVTLPEGGGVVVENLSGDDGFSVQFRARRTMDDSLGSLTVDLWNLGPDALGALESSQVRRTDDLDAALSGCTLFDAGVSPDADDAGPAGFAVVELEAGYDGQLSRVFRGVGCHVDSEREDGVSNKTTISVLENLDGLLFGLAMRTFPAGATTFEVVDYLRSCLGLGPGNLDFASWSALLGPSSKLNAPYHVSAGDALELLKTFLEYLPARWWVDDRQIWVCGRDGVPNVGKVPPHLLGVPHTLPPLLRRPRRRDGGLVEVVCFLAPAPAPGELVLLTPGGLTLPGVASSPEQVARAQVPPGLYRVEVVDHAGDTSSDGDDSFTSTFLLRGMPGL